MTAPEPLEAYTAMLTDQLASLADQRDAINAAATAIADTIVADGLVRIFGTGHSHIIAEEMFYRAGGLAAVDPILIEGLLLHAGAELSTTLERTAGLGSVIFEQLGARPEDTLIVVTNSGSNVIARELVERARGLGMVTIALVSAAAASSAASRVTGATRADQLADIVLDNRGMPGDAVLEVEGVDVAMGPTSTVMGAAIVNIVAMTAASIAASRGVQPAVFTSSNVAGGEERNRAALAAYRARVRSL